MDQSGKPPYSVPRLPIDSCTPPIPIRLSLSEQKDAAVLGDRHRHLSLRAEAAVIVVYALENGIRVRRRLGSLMCRSAPSQHSAVAQSPRGPTLSIALRREIEKEE